MKHFKITPTRQNIKHTKTNTTSHKLFDLHSRTVYVCLSHTVVIAWIAAAMCHMMFWGNILQLSCYGIRPCQAPLTSDIWLSLCTLGYTVAHSAVGWGVEGQLFSTSKQQVPISSRPCPWLVAVPPKNVSYLALGLSVLSRQKQMPTFSPACCTLGEVWSWQTGHVEMARGI